MLCPFGTSGIAPIYKMVVGETRCASPPPRSSRGAQRRGDPEARAARLDCFATLAV